MFRPRLPALAVGWLLLLAACGWRLVWGGAQAPQPTLPGARAVIDAEHYPSLQAAIDALPPGGGLVRLPPGEFTLTEPLIIRASNTTLAGAGAATHLKNANTNRRPAIILEHPHAAASAENRLWRVRLADFRLTGNPLSGHGVEAREVNELFLEGLSVSEHGEDGLRLDHCYEDPRICDCLVTYNRGAGLNLLGCHDIVVSANQFEENRDAVRCADGFNLTCTGNAIDDHLGHGVVIENTYGSVVAANMIEECLGTAIVLDRDCYGVALSANVIAHNGRGVDLRDAHGVSIAANTFTLMKADAVLIGAGSGRTTVAANSFCDSYIGAGKSRRAADDLDAGGLAIEGGADLVVSGNSFSGVRPRALSIDGAPSRLLFSSNIITGSPSDGDDLSAPSLSADNLFSD